MSLNLSNYSAIYTILDEKYEKKTFEIKSNSKFRRYGGCTAFNPLNFDKLFYIGGFIPQTYEVDKTVLLDVKTGIFEELSHPNYKIWQSFCTNFVSRDAFYS